MDLVKSQRSKFPKISDHELAEREYFVKSLKDDLKHREKLISKREKAIKKGQREALLSGGSSFDEHEKEQQQLLFETEKDTILVNMEEALGRLGENAGNIGVELVSHSELIQDMDSDMYDAMGRLQFVQRGMERLLGKGNKGKCKCLFCEIAIILILVFLIVYV